MKKVIIIGGGTFAHVRNHLSIAMPAFGYTAESLEKLCRERFDKMETELYLTKMADPTGLRSTYIGESELITNEDVKEFIDRLKEDMDTKVIFLNVGLCDYTGSILEEVDKQGPGGTHKITTRTKSGKYNPRLKTSQGTQLLELTPADKIIKTIREGRKDIFLVAFKTTCGATEQEQYLEGLSLLKKNSCNLVLANDTKTRVNMIITPEEAKYHVTTNRIEVLKELVDMTYLRSHLSFTHSTVVAGTPVPWSSEEVFPSLRKVVNFCIESGAYKPFNGATVGHFACKISDDEFLTSIRKSNFNDLEKNGLVRIKTSGPDTVIAYGAKPSVGGQSQRIIFSDHKDKEYDCIAHFHCPIKEGSQVPVVSQREYECGSHQCGENTSHGLKQFGNLSAVMLDNHGPNIVFNHNIDPQEVINFISENFDLSAKTGGPVQLKKEKI